MNLVICTLFEGLYHYGVAALTNSLYANGYRGEIYAGYRGELPLWATTARENQILPFRCCRTLQVAEGLELHFVPLDTDYHLTNYKPDFMLRLWRESAKEAKAIIYFDPDIIFNTPWTFMEEWVSYGVAVCEDVNSPLAAYHPRRMAWRQYFAKRDIHLEFKEHFYANGGFVGVSEENKSFLEIWKLIQQEMAPIIGGLNCSSLKGRDPLPKEMIGFLPPFSKTDQDALNATVEAWEGKVSFVGKDGMAFIAGNTIMPHALGEPKPWLWKPISRALYGRPPRRVDRYYWKSVSGPILPYTSRLVYMQNVAIKIASFIGRFYKREST